MARGEAGAHGAKPGASPWVPARGDVVWISMAATSGRQRSGRRPALVLSPVAYNAKVGRAVFCPISSQAKGYPFEVPVPDGLPVRGVVLADQVKSLDWRSRGAELICAVAAETTTAVLQRLHTLVGA
jgi:mRNA interferase MazF